MEFDTDIESQIIIQKNLRRALDESSMVTITDKNGIITYVNKQFCETTEYSSDELIGKTSNFTWIWPKKIKVLGCPIYDKINSQAIEKSNTILVTTAPPKKDLPNIFNPLFTTKKQGTGLGLVRVKSIVQAHGGTIFVTSIPTIFRITLPKN